MIGYAIDIVLDIPIKKIIKQMAIKKDWNERNKINIIKKIINIIPKLNKYTKVRLDRVK